MKDTMQNREKKPSRKKYIIPVVVLLCILAALIYRAMTWTPIDSESVRKSKAMILNIAARKLEKDPNELTNEDFKNITSLLIGNKMLVEVFELSDVTMLEKFTNLQTLSLKYVQFPEKDIPSWMKILAGLKIINLSGRFNLDLSPLEKLSELETISLGGCHVSDLRPLRNLKNLNDLSIGSTNVTNLKPLSGLTKLRRLNLDYTQVANLEPLKNLKNLYSLSLWNTEVSDLKPIKGLTNLEFLYLPGTQVTDLEPLKGLSKLRTLYLDNTQISDIKPLHELKVLINLNIGRCPNLTDGQVEDLQKALPDLKINR